MSFTLLPAVDVANGQAVRLVQGDAASETAHGAPLEVALRWQTAGAEWIHLVDLDAAFGRGSNATLLAKVVAELDVQVELSGGVHDEPSLNAALASGCARVVIATSAIHDPGWCARVIAEHGERIAVALDVRIAETGYRLAARGGTGDGGDVWEAVARLDREGCARYIVTDVTKDGTLRGPNLELYRQVGAITPAAVIASGGIASIDDLVALAGIAAGESRLEGAIVGQALYAGRFTLTEALEATRLPGVGLGSGAARTGEDGVDRGQGVGIERDVESA